MLKDYPNASAERWPRANLLDWRQHILDVILRGAAAAGGVALVVGSIDLLPAARWLDFSIYASAYIGILVLAFARRLSFGLRTGIFLALAFGFGVWRLLDEGLAGDGRLFLLAFPVLMTALIGARSGAIALVFTLGTIVSVGWAETSGLIAIPSLDSSAQLSVWVGSGAILGFLTAVLMISQHLLSQAQARATEASLENVELRETRRALRERTADLEKTGAHLAQCASELETARVQQVGINRQLEQAVQDRQYRVSLLQASAQVSSAVAQIRDMDGLLRQLTQLISENLNFYHVGLFLIDDAGRYAILRDANSVGGQRMLARGHRLAVGSQGIVGYATGTGRPRIALDVSTDAAFFNNPDLPDTRSEMAAPLRVGDTVIGALDVQSVQKAAFGQEDIALLTILADQIAVAIDNAQLIEQTQAALAETQATYHRYLRQEWDGFLRHRSRGRGTKPTAVAPITLKRRDGD